MMDNYPDDIRKYDNDPRSPFFVGTKCENCGDEDGTCFCPVEDYDDEEE